VEKSRQIICAISVIFTKLPTVKFAKSGHPAHGVDKGCHKVYFQTKNPNLGKFLRALEWKMLAYLCSFVIFFGIFSPFWHIVWLPWCGAMNRTDVAFYFMSRAGHLYL
jgi:hypothetical protein